MKSVFALVAAVAVLVSAQPSEARKTCNQLDRSGRGQLSEPRGKQIATPKQAPKEAKG